jgi:hypothetical protein
MDNVKYHCSDHTATLRSVVLKYVARCGPVGAASTEPQAPTGGTASLQHSPELEGDSWDSVSIGYSEALPKRTRWRHCPHRANFERVSTARPPVPSRPLAVPSCFTGTLAKAIFSATDP